MANSSWIRLSGLRSSNGMATRRTLPYTETVTRSDKMIIVMALVPPAVYLALVSTWLLRGSVPFAAGTVSGTGAVIAICSVAFANLTRMRRDAAGG
jgi:hypothetical protein